MPDVTTPPAPPRRWGRGLLLLLVLLGGLLGVGLTFFLDPWLRRTLEQQVATSSHGRYHLHITELRTHLWRRGLTLRGLQLSTLPATSSDTATLPHLRLTLGRVQVNGIGLLALLRRQEVPVDSITLDSLRVHLAALPRPATPQPLHKQLPLEGVRVGSMALRHARATYGPGPQPSLQLGQTALVLQDVWISAAGAADSARIGYAAGVAMQIRGAALQVPGHTVKVVGAAFSSGSRRLQLDSVLLRPQQPISNVRSQAMRVSLAVPRLELAGLDAARLSRGRFRADTLRVSRPRLALTLPSQPPPALAEVLRPYLAECRLQHLAVAEGQLRVAGLEVEPAFSNVTVAATQVQVLPLRAAQNIFYAQAWRLQTGRATATLDAPYYHLSWQSLQADSQTGKAQFRQVLLVPTLRVEALARAKGHQAAHITARLPEVRLTGLDFRAAANRQELQAHDLLILRPQVSTRSDGRFTSNPRVSTVTPEALGRLPFRFQIARVRLQEGTVHLSYRSPREPEPGLMTIDRLQVRLRNLTNHPRRMSAATPLTGEATGWLQNQCGVRLQLRANLLDATGRHTLVGAFGPASLSILNPMLVPTRGIGIRSGEVHSIRFQMQLDQAGARGRMWGRYANLKLQLLNQQERPGLFHRLQTSVVNGVFIRDHNPRKPGQPLQPGSMTSTRERRYSVFSLWRQGIVSGLLNSAGVPAALAKKLSEAE
ncbi:DUF748 domain-containing protein [Hymenobacter sp. HSC-4F20]|uniref:DUF748 domain-containing protein n=1 Tax=Hymenobacter sp. HSC-4F20 TaxID=2864135 RepID=UPI001C73A789|nr:DUF748 domain-containing protein [Hymenobacter sp. HSC-4F20]MBX0288920.1 DUF748 domain-containing protein [Hymenobacter sp. HSC-4F20]